MLQDNCVDVFLDRKFSINQSGISIKWQLFWKVVNVNC